MGSLPDGDAQNASDFTAQASVEKCKDLSMREREVLAMIGQGLSTAEIARRLHRSARTIQSHRHSLGKKLGVSNRVELARLAIRAGLVRLDISPSPESRDDDSLHEELEQSRTLLSDASTMMHFGTFEWIVESGTVIWSPELYEIFGVDPSTFTPNFDSYIACVHPDDRAKVMEAIEKLMGGDSVVEMRERIVRPDKTVRQLRTRIHRSGAERSRNLKVYGICADVTDRSDRSHRPT